MEPVMEDQSHTHGKQSIMTIKSYASRSKYVGPRIGKTPKPKRGLPELEWHSFPPPTKKGIPKPKRGSPNEFGDPDLSAVPIWGLKRVFPNWNNPQTNSG